MHRMRDKSANWRLGPVIRDQSANRGFGPASLVPMAIDVTEQSFEAEVIDASRYRMRYPDGTVSELVDSE